MAVEQDPSPIQYNPFNHAVGPMHNRKVPTTDTRCLIREVLSEVSGVNHTVYGGSSGGFDLWLSIDASKDAIIGAIKEVFNRHTANVKINDKVSPPEPNQIQVSLVPENRTTPEPKSECEPTQIETGFDHLGPDQPTKI